MIAAPVGSLRRRAEAARDGIADDRVSVAEMESDRRRGSLPGETLASWGLALAVRSAGRMLERLRVGTPAVIGRIADGRVLLDLRTVEPEADLDLLAALRSSLRP